MVNQTINNLDTHQVLVVLRRAVIKVDDFPQDYGRAEALQKLAAEKSPFTSTAAKAA